MKTLILTILSISSVLGATNAMAGHTIYRVNCQSMEVDISARSGIYRINTSGFDDHSFVSTVGDLSPEDFVALKTQVNPRFPATATVVNGSNGYDSMNDYSGLLTLEGSILDIKAIALNLKLTAVRGEHAVRGPTQIEKYLTNCKVLVE
jgi:hypothetical protein